MDEFGESPSIYVWPLDKEEGEWNFVDDVMPRLRECMKAAGLGWEST